MRATKTFRQLASVMLFWLTFPPGTAGVERDFSFMTLVCQQTRRRKMGIASFRVAVLSMCFKARLASMAHDAR